MIVEKGAGLTGDFMGQPLAVGSKVMLPPLMPCGRCHYCVHYPETANKCLTPVYYGRHLGFERPRICTKDINLLGSRAFTANDVPLGIAMLDRARDRYPWTTMQTLFPFTEAGVGEAIAAALAMRTVKSTVVPDETLV